MYALRRLPQAPLLLLGALFIAHCGGRTSQFLDDAGDAGVGDSSAGQSGSSGVEPGDASAGVGAGGSGQAGADAGAPDANLGGADAGMPDGALQDSGPDVIPGDAGDPEREALSDAWATIRRDYCQGLAHCCSAEGKAYSQAQCEAAIDAEAQNQLNQIDSHRERGHHLDFERLSDTVLAYRQAAQSCADGDPVEQARYWIGEQALGTKCDRPEYCALEADARLMVCSYWNEPVGQACAAVKVSKLGEYCNAGCREVWESCSYFNDPGFVHYTCLLEDNLYCNFSSRKCEPAAKTGEACGGEVLCREGLYCTLDTRICAPLPKAGEPCPSLQCDASSFCYTDTLCAPKRANGEACDFDLQCMSESCGWKGCGSGPEPQWFGFCD